jgi:predicted nucleotide-binding protein
LGRIFSSQKIADEYRRSGITVMRMGNNRMQDLNDLKERISERINRLESIKERLELIDAPLNIAGPERQTQSTPESSDEVFVVHGHDHSALEQVCRVLEKLPLPPIVLHEQANEGRTLIEKFEDHSNSFCDHTPHT